MFEAVTAAIVLDIGCRKLFNCQAWAETDHGMPDRFMLGAGEMLPAGPELNPEKLIVIDQRLYNAFTPPPPFFSFWRLAMEFAVNGEFEWTPDFLEACNISVRYL